MLRPRLSTELLIWSLLIICGLTGGIVLIVRHTVRSAVNESVRAGTDASIHAFQSVQHQREVQLSRSAAMLAELPTLKALMTTEHAPTIQDGSEPFWRLAGSDLFLLAGTDGHVYAIHVKKPGWGTALAEQELKQSLEQGEDAPWWYADGQLYQVFLHPILAGGGNSPRQLGVVAVGYQVDTAVAQQLAVVAESQIALTTGPNVIASTLPQSAQGELQSWIAREGSRSGSNLWNCRSVASNTRSRPFSFIARPGRRAVFRVDVPGACQSFPPSIERQDFAGGDFGGDPRSRSAQLLFAHD